MKASATALYQPYAVLLVADCDLINARLHGAASRSRAVTNRPRKLQSDDVVDLLDLQPVTQPVAALPSTPAPPAPAESSEDHAMARVGAAAETGEYLRRLLRLLRRLFIDD